MSRQCLICASGAVITCEAAKGLALLLGLVDGAIQGARRAPVEDSHDALTNGLKETLPSYPSALRAAEYIGRFHFAGFECLCLRCGVCFKACRVATSSTTHNSCGSFTSKKPCGAEPDGAHMSTFEWNEIRQRLAALFFGYMTKLAVAGVQTVSVNFGAVLATRIPSLKLSGARAPKQLSRQEETAWRLTNNRHLYKAHNLAERFFHKLKQFRQIAPRYERLTRNYQSMLSLVSVVIWLT